ncbi:hypothetical protein BKA82DRAFT_20061 [Pisolithus tinctorius]|uniref:Uncharacterized protein n=1 Tax=Pisolithus tinctorius Marx 270 TaxID=870435 RepID=A0A0C3PST1_PISTI|nr:hypothetical protein BKA82DRAFT_20061 [Pisolithus tinctorius]KIO12231.1 hypothetical protein M404DRAFT_20061 [Pisolithus tinctorius Marx 270]
MTSTKLSAFTISQHGDLVGLPSSASIPRRRSRHDRDRSQGLDVIHKVSSNYSMDYTPSRAGPSHSRGQSYKGDREAVDSEATLRRQDGRKLKQQFADELRYSDPTTIKEWRRQRLITGIQQTVGCHQTSGFLSPDHANIPLPIPPPAGCQGHQRRPSSPASLAPIVPNSPAIPTSDPGQMFNGLPDGQLPTHCTPTRSSDNNADDGPVIPQNLRAAPQRCSQTPSASSQPGERERQRESMRNQYAPPERERERDRRPRTFSYPTSPTPAGLAYPAPPISRESAGPGSPSQSTLDE